MMNVLAQNPHYDGSGFSRLLESAPTDEIMVMFVVGTIFSTVLMIVLTVCITNTIRAIKIAKISSQLTEKLVKEGMPCEQVERLVRANNRRFNFPKIGLPASLRKSRWQKAAPPSQQTPGKPVAMRT